MEIKFDEMKDILPCKRGTVSECVTALFKPNNYRQLEILLLWNSLLFQKLKKKKKESFIIIPTSLGLYVLHNEAETFHIYLF